MNIPSLILCSLRSRFVIEKSIPELLCRWASPFVPAVNEQELQFLAVVILTADKETIRIRFNGIDCPERGQPFGNKAKQFVSDSIGGKMVRVVTHGGDKYDRTVGDIYAGEELINLSLVEAGLAWHYVKYAPDRSGLADAETNARTSNVGLWGGSHKPIPPWDWRKLSKEERDQHR